MVVPFGYERLFFDSEINLFPAIFAIVSITLLFSNLLCIEYTDKADRLLLACQKGDRVLLHYKLRITLISGFLITLLAYLPNIIHVFNKYGVDGLYASITSLSVFSSLPASMNILTYIILSYLLKLSAIESTVFLLFLLSKWLRHQSLVIFLLLTITVVPLILHMMGIPFLESISLYPFICSSSLFKNGQYLLVSFHIIGYSLFMIFCYGFAFSHAKFIKRNNSIFRLYLKYTKK